MSYTKRVSFCLIRRAKRESIFEYQDIERYLIHKLYEFRYEGKAPVKCPVKNCNAIFRSLDDVVKVPVVVDLIGDE